MNIPEINSWQLGVLTDLSSVSPTLVLVAPDPSDPPEQRAQREKSNKDTDQMVELGLIEDANKEGMFDTYIQAIKNSECRPTVRIFRITELGFTLFQSTGEKVTVH
jgi:hypothetical protein